MFFEDFAKPSEIQILIVLKKNQAEVEFTEGQLKVWYFHDWLFVATPQCSSQFIGFFSTLSIVIFGNC